MLNIHNVIKKNKNSTILQSLSFSIKKMEIVGLAGPSGSGKTTLLRSIQGLEKINAGSIKMNGTSGFMFQDFQLFPHLTVIENLLYAPSLHDSAKNHIPAAEQLLKELGIYNKKESLPKHLSGGQKQRVALARSLMMHPDLLLCDEPTSGLDVATINDVVQLLSSVRDKGITMLIASHDLDFLTKIADRIIVLKEGKLIVDMNPGEHKNPIEYLTTLY